MIVNSIGVLSPGDMGQAVAQQFQQNGFAVATALDSRSARTKALAREAGIADVGSIESLTQECDVILSILDPAAALDLASQVAQALSTNRRNIMFVDCNAIAPGTMQTIYSKITAVGSRCVDGCILDSPPRGDVKTYLHLAGPDARELLPLAIPQVGINVLSDRIGDASAIKMCLSAMQRAKLITVVELLIAARRLGVEGEVKARIKAKHGSVYDEIIAALPRMPSKAYRLAPEMHEIARTFESVGMTPRIYQGAADMYEFVAATKLAKERPESRDPTLTGEDILRLLADETD